MSKINEVYDALRELEQRERRGINAAELSNFMGLDRANVSRYLNKLYSNKLVDKIDGRPVVYCIAEKAKEENKDEPNKVVSDSKASNSLDMLVGSNLSLQMPIQQAKAAILYPPRGLHTLILGETGVGKSMFAEAMYQFAKEYKMIDQDAPFIRFNCADYADNPQLVMAQIFGVKKGAYTGADQDREGLLKKADGGIIFLDEIHRLSPQGQEMLFTYIDKGYFRVLGDTEKLVRAEVQIISATTEEPQSFLLKTFTRRIPMTITLPPLADRSISERYYLLEEFIKAESKRLTKSIYFNKNALISFLLYDCPNNIGQLKSDVQLSCAKAFLNYKANSRDYILIEQADLHQRVKKGLMKIQDHREEIDQLLQNVGDVLKFSFKDDVDLKLGLLELDEYKKGEFFYDIIENKLESLKKKGIEEKEINEILNIDIDRYFKKYIRDLPQKFRKDEISKIVDIEIVNLVEQVLGFATKKLNRDFDEKVYFGLALHLQGSLDRIRQGTKIFHPKLNFVRSEYNDEFMVAMEIAQIIDKKFNIEVPLDEIGYITMFLATNPYEVDDNVDGKVGVLVIMHGHTTASSMVEVANSLIGEEFVEALDMPLNMKAEAMYEVAKIKIKEMDNGKGVFLLVDMGSLTNFGDMVKEETGIRVKTIDMVSTLSVIEAGRKALNGRELEDIYDSCLEISRYGIQASRLKEEKRDKLILTTCFTGEGSAERLKKIILSNIEYNYGIKVEALDILDKEDFYSKVRELNKKYNIIAVVGAINTYLENVPFISATDILTGEGTKYLEELIKQEEEYEKIADSIGKQLTGLDSGKLVLDVRSMIINIEEKLNIKISYEVKIGILIHTCFLIDKLINGGKETPFAMLNNFRNENNREFILIKQCLRAIEMSYEVNIGENELAYIVRMIINNCVI
ncbi:sigma 54 modulation protein [Clostridium cavendishii DSM 21758]|uniref:Sigma 54 modulation protein n=1 Tax=Clostridium cavendishii DSM 21758 TaxID=1121302 RepID=A0A1M6U921_9CLOT|nr:sigma-54-dependent transcriptional regulator [Clostridium cavendishii]SHK65673.1 sigma 54 modulation protein [Clostridium cavendishii DSM 21758]